MSAPLDLGRPMIARLAAAATAGAFAVLTLTSQPGADQPTTSPDPLAHVAGRPAADPGCWEDELAVPVHRSGPGTEWRCIPADDLGRQP